MLAQEIAYYLLFVHSLMLPLPQGLECLLRAVYHVWLLSLSLPKIITLQLDNKADFRDTFRYEPIEH